MDESKWRVLPKKVDPKPLPHIPNLDSAALSDSERKEIDGLGGSAGLFVFVAAFVAGMIIGSSSGMPAAGALVLGGVSAFAIVKVVNFVIIGNKVSIKEREKARQQTRWAESQRRDVEQANETAVKDAEREAERQTSSALQAYITSASVAAELPRSLDKASDWVRYAEKEFKDSAFGPFWDAVESAARTLATFNEQAAQLSRAADTYYRALNGRPHTFPAFHTSPANIPDAKPVLQDLRRVVRMGQTNFQFANIWEHRRTREVMIAGFRTLGEAINNLDNSVENAVYGLQQSISSDVAHAVQEQIRTRDTLDRRLVEQNRMLDNIQQHRKPSVLDGPSRY